MSTQYFRNLVMLNGVVPLAILCWDALRGQLGANAVNNAIHITGIASLVFLFLSLLITPLRILTGWNSLIAYRRALGLYGFLYAAIHLVIYVGWDRMGSVMSTIEEITTRRFLTVGVLALLIMVPLAVTSTNAMIRWMGAARWKLLHRLAYVATILGVMHYYMLVKSDVRQPLAFALVLTPILGFRVVKHYRDLRSQAKRGVLTGSDRLPKPQFYSGELQVANIHQETHDVKTFRLVHPSGGDLPFRHKPGQYMTLHLDIDGMRVRRSYTLASAPTQRGFVELTIKLNPAGLVSRYMHERVTVGQRIRVAAPGGKFWFDGMNGSKSVLLIAGGVGITPVMSMLRYLTDSVWSGEIYFINAVRSSRDLIFQYELMSIAWRHANVRVVNFLSQYAVVSAPGLSEVADNAIDQQRWQIRGGYIDSASIRELVPELTSTPVYLCGPEPMMQAVRATLASLGIADDQVFTEEFVSPPPGAMSDEDDSSSGQAEETAAQLLFAKSKVETSVNAGVTVLEAAESADVQINWECRSGICGQCKVRCRSGSVAMETTDALTSSERREGWILACQAKATSQQLEIDA